MDWNKAYIETAKEQIDEAKHLVKEFLEKHPEISDDLSGNEQHWQAIAREKVKGYLLSWYGENLDQLITNNRQIESPVKSLTYSKFRRDLYDQFSCRKDLSNSHDAIRRFVTYQFKDLRDQARKLYTARKKENHDGWVNIHENDRDLLFESSVEKVMALQFKIEVIEQIVYHHNDKFDKEIGLSVTGQIKNSEPDADLKNKDAIPKIPDEMRSILGDIADWGTIFTFLLDQCIILSDLRARDLDQIQKRTILNFIDLLMDRCYFKEEFNRKWTKVIDSWKSSFDGLEIGGKDNFNGTNRYKIDLNGMKKKKKYLDESWEDQFPSKC